MKRMMIGLLGLCIAAGNAGLVFAEAKSWERVALITPGAVSPEEDGAKKIAEFIEKGVESGQVADKEDVLKAISGASASDAEVTFVSYIWDHVPAGVRILTGKSSYLNGFSADLIFTANQETFEEISREYNRLPLTTVEARAKGWFPEDITVIPDILCYFRTDGLNKYYLFWDKAGERVFFKGIES